MKIKCEFCCSMIMEELGLEHILNPNQLRKKWNYLVAKYKVSLVHLCMQV